MSQDDKSKGLYNKYILWISMIGITSRRLKLMWAI